MCREKKIQLLHRFLILSTDTFPSEAHCKLETKNTRRALPVNFVSMIITLGPHDAVCRVVGKGGTRPTRERRAKRGCPRSKRGSPCSGRESDVGAAGSSARYSFVIIVVYHSTQKQQQQQQHGYIFRWLEWCNFFLNHNVCV